MSSADFQIGEVRVTRILEGAPDVMAVELFSGPAAEVFDSQRPRLPSAWFDPAGQPLLPISAFVLATDTLTVLVDSCVGTWPTPLNPVGAARSDFLDALGAAGFGRDDIDVVVATHMHFDHVGGHTYRDTDGAIQPTFPRAVYLFGAAEWQAQSAAAQHNPALASLNYTVRPLLTAGHAELIDGDHQIGAGIAVVSTPGHSPGHLCVRIDSGGQTAIVTGDVAHNPVQLTVPEIGSIFDQDPDLAVRTRGALAARCAEDGTVLLGTHFPGRGIGTLERSAAGLEYVEAE